MLLDFDFGLRNLDIILGLEQAVVYDISDVLEGRCRLRQAVIHPWNAMKVKTELYRYYVRLYEQTGLYEEYRRVLPQYLFKVTLNN